MTDRVPYYEAVYSATIVNGATLSNKQIMHIVDTVLDLHEKTAAAMVRSVEDRDGPSLSDQMAMEDATTLVEKELGGTEVSDQKLEAAPDIAAGTPFNDGEFFDPPTAEPTSAQVIAHEGIGARSAAHRTMCSQRAQFPHPVLLDRRFRPSTYGYSGEDFKRDYPHANPRETLEKFFSHHIDKGDLHRNWLEKFWSYALMADRIAREQAADKTSTDSMGQPLDPAERARRVQVARQHARENDAYIDEQIEKESNHE